jgi:uncharacterized membrane protein YkoI
MRALMLALSAAASLAVAAPALGQKTVGMGATPQLNLTGFSGDPRALTNAVTAIEGRSGGRVAEIRFDNVDGAPGYDVVLVKADNVRFQRINVQGGAPVEYSESKTPKWMLGWRSRGNARLVRDATVPLADAIRTAQASMNNAPAVAAGISHGASSAATRVHAYNVAVLRNGAQRRVAVNSQTGGIISNPQALPRW